MMQQEEKTERRYHNAELKVLGPPQKAFNNKLLRDVDAKESKKPPTKPKASLKQPPAYQAPVVSLVRGAGPDGGGNGPLTVAANINSGGYSQAVEIPMSTGWAQAVMNGTATTSVEPRFPDPFRLSPSSVTLVNTSYAAPITSLTSSTSTLPNFAAAFVLKGDPVVSAFGCSVATTTGIVDWTYAGRTWGPLVSGMVSTDFYTRPNGCVFEITPLMRGIEHTITINAMPILPWASTSFGVAAMPGFFTDVRLSPTGYQRYVGARQWVFKPGDEAIRLVSLPVDSRCLDFVIGGTERNGVNLGSMCGWTGWIVTMYGFTSSDALDIRTRFVEEIMPVAFNSTTNYSYPTSIRHADPAKAAAAVNEIMEAAQAGLTGIKMVDKAANWVANKVRSAAQTVWQGHDPILVGSDLGAFPMLQAPPPNAMPTTMSAWYQCAVAHAPTEAREEKEDEFTKIDTAAKARRNTLSSPLTVDVEQPPASARRAK